MPLIENINLGDSSLIKSSEALQVGKSSAVPTHQAQELQIKQVELNSGEDASCESAFDVEKECKRYKDLYDFAPAGYLTLSNDGHILEINSTALTLLRQSRAHLLGMHFANIVRHEDLSNWCRNFRNLIFCPGRATIDLGVRCGDGNLIEVHLKCLSTQRRLSEASPWQTNSSDEVRMIMIENRIRTDLSLVPEDSHIASSANIQHADVHSSYRASALENCRRKIAGELHDRTSSNLAAIQINLAILELALKEHDWVEIASRLEDNRALIEDTAASIRDVCYELRPPILDREGLVSAMRSYAKQHSRRTGIVVDFDCEESFPTLDNGLEIRIFRIFQEALTNIAKHAQATIVRVSLRFAIPFVHLSIEDNGCGFDSQCLANENGLGIINMRDMVKLSSGTFSLQSFPGHGTRIQVELSCKP